MDIREALRSSELWALVVGVVLQGLAFHRLLDPVQATAWAENCFSYAALRFVSKTVKASIPVATK